MFMNGGINRHISGLTRVTTNKALSQFLSAHRHAYPNITTPRVWAWQPPDTSWLHLSLHHGKTHATTTIAREYALINDLVEYQAGHTAPRDIVFSLFCATDNLFDPHDGNCVYEIPTQSYVILDTESFMTMIGFSRPRYTHSYVGWYVHLISYCILRVLFAELTRPTPESAYVQLA